MHRGNVAEAEADFQQAVAAAPQLADGYFGLGLAQLRQAKLPDAEHSLHQALERNPQLQGAHMFLGIAEYQSNDLPQAEQALQQEIALQPKNVEALSWLGMVELGMQHPDKAASVLDTAAILAPTDENVQYYRGRAHTQAAQQAYHALYQIDPDSWLVHRALGEELSASGQHEKAIGEFQAALQKQPSNSDLYEDLGEEEQSLARFDDAAKAYEHQLQLNPHSPIALYNLGKIKVEHGDPSTGIDYLQKAIEEHVNPAPAYFYLGTGLAALGKNEEAVPWLEKALLNHPSEFIEESDEYQLVRVYQKLGRKEDSLHAAEQLKALKAKTAPSAFSKPASQP
jgi:tetratricopeptide (TPR) repeat protein